MHIRIKYLGPVLNRINSWYACMHIRIKYLGPVHTRINSWDPCKSGAKPLSFMHIWIKFWVHLYQNQVLEIGIHRIKSWHPMHNRIKSWHPMYNKIKSWHPMHNRIVSWHPMHNRIKSSDP
jgi:hypothetical protein